MNKFLSSFVFVLTVSWANAQISDSSLVAYYPLDSNTSDYSVYGNPGVNHGAVPATDRFGNPKGAYYFDGISSFIDCGNHPRLKRYQSDFTISVWAKAYSISTSYGSYLVSNRYSNYEGSGLGINGSLSTDKYAAPTLVISGGEKAQAVRTNISIDTSWHNIITTFKYTKNNYNEAAVYVDGVLSGTSLVQDVVDPNLYATYIGFEVSNMSPVQYHFHGKIDDVRIYNRVISSNEIRKLAGKECNQTSILKIEGVDILNTLGLSGVWYCNNTLLSPRESGRIQALRTGNYKLVVTHDPCMVVDSIYFPGIVLDSHSILIAPVVPEAIYEWFYENELLKDISGNAFRPEKSGHYTVKITFYVPNQRTTALLQAIYETDFENTITNIQNSDVLKITVTPNHSDGIFEIGNLSVAQGGDILIENMAGQEVFRQTVPAATSQRQINISHCNKGIYVLKVTSEKGYSIQKIMVE